MATSPQSENQNQTAPDTLAKRIAWFVGIWIASVLTLAIVALIIKKIIR